MKKILFIILFSAISLIGYSTLKTSALPNPWIDCEDDISCGAKKAGFNLPIRVKDYYVRAMDGLLEINFPLDKKRNVSLRKTLIYTGNENLSGVYYDFPINKTVTLKNGVVFNLKGKKKTYYIANFSAETGYYSIYSKEGLKLKDINYFYELLEEAEAPRHDYSDKNNSTLEELAKERTVDGIVEPVFTQDCFPRTLQKKGVTKNCFERANLGQDIFCSASEIKMIKDYYKRGQKKDPLNNGSGQFCAKE